MTSSLAKRLRSNPTDAEKRMWRLLFPFRESGLHFRKQAPIGPYVADFACHHARIVIEVDGGQHFSPDGHEADQRRTKFLESKGYKVLRFSNLDVLTNADGVELVLADALAQCEPSSRVSRSK